MKRTALVLMAAVSLLFDSASVHAQTYGNSDEQGAAETLQYALEYNRSSESANWVNPDSGNTASATPVNTYQNDAGLYCREYRQTIVIGGKTEEGYGTACRQPDGSWQVVPEGSAVATAPQAVENSVVERRVYVDEWPYYGYYPRYRYSPYYPYPYYPYYAYPNFLFSFGYIHSSGHHHHGGYWGGKHGGGGHRGGHGGGGHRGGHGGGRR